MVRLELWSLGLENGGEGENPAESGLLLLLLSTMFPAAISCHWTKKQKYCLFPENTEELVYAGGTKGVSSEQSPTSKFRNKF